MLPVPGGAVVPGAGECTRRWTSVSGVVAGPPSTPPSAGPSGMLSSPGTPQTAKITRSAVCNSALAANEKRVAGGGGLRGSKLLRRCAMHLVFGHLLLWEAERKPLKAASVRQK